VAQGGCDGGKVQAPGDFRKKEYKSTTAESKENANRSRFHVWIGDIYTIGYVYGLPRRPTMNDVVKELEIIR